MGGAVSSKIAADASGVGEGVECQLPVCGTLGKGQVTSLSLSGQNGRIWLYKYHCLSVDRYFGVTAAGKLSGSGCQGSFKI